MPRTKISGKYRPIDNFFQSLASEYKEKAIGVILSGIDSDGALGLEAIKAEGGITFAQSQDSAQFQSMPLRTPLSPILMWAQLLKAGNSNTAKSQRRLSAIW